MEHFNHSDSFIYKKTHIVHHYTVGCCQKMWTNPYFSLITTLSACVICVKYTSSTEQNLSHYRNCKMKLIKSVGRWFTGWNLTSVNSMSHWVLWNKGHSQRLLVRTGLLILSDNRAQGESFSTTLPVFLFHATYINRTLPRGATQTLGQSLPSMSRALTTH